VKHTVVNVTEFKAKCLALLDDIGPHGGSITITKRGKPLATVKPAHRTAWKNPAGSLAGKLIIDDDLLMADMSDLWECVNPPRGAGR
jgi:antitoxin (DNA-binding transcriptional repressor) of toxin-antitoxin stability system